MGKSSSNICQDLVEAFECLRYAYEATVFLKTATP
jgi:hypothetical protein